MALDIDERHLLRMGHGEEELETEKDYSRSPSYDIYLTFLYLYPTLALYTLWVIKKDQRHFSLITLPNVGRFLKFFHHWIQQETYNKVFVIFPTSPCEM